MPKIVFATVTLGAAATQLIATHTPVLELHVESDTGNDPVKLGGPTVATDDYGSLVAAGPANEKVYAQGPSGAAAFNLDDVWALGTAGNKIRIAYIKH